MDFGKICIILGLMLIAVGILWGLGARLGLGRLPGDIVVRGERVTFHFPLVTCLILSVLLSLAFGIVRLLARR
jgi:hypothetical protein